MPEGDTVYRAAKRLDAVLTGHELTLSDFRVPAFATLDLTGERVDSVVSRGKHLLMRVGEHSIHSHLKMEGSWHIYQHDTAWRRPAWQARAVLAVEGWTAVGFQLGILEVVERSAEDTVVGHLGPDLLGPDWDAAKALARLIAGPDRPIALALLDQRVLAGLGNEYVNELCFLRGVLPTRPVGEVPDPERMIALASRLIHANTDRVDRTTTGNLRGNTSWVYGRARKPCLRCGTRIVEGTIGESALTQRVSLWCPQCQT